MRDVTKEVVIMVTGTNIKPHDENHKECEATWVPRLRELGFKVIIAVGNPEIDKRKTKIPEDWVDYYKFIDDNTIQFNTFDTKDGLFDKSIFLPAKWVLEETNYKYYFRVDSDSFIAPVRFKKMLEENLFQYPDVDYMGCCLPWNGWNPHEHKKMIMCRHRHFAAGAGYMVSRRAMRIALEKMRVLQPYEFQADDWVLGRAMWENGIPLLHDSRIYFESKHKVLIKDYKGLGQPDIADKQSHLALQHYMNGQMKDAAKKLGWG